MENDSEWVTVSEAARRLGVSRTTIQNWMKRGRVQHRQDNRGNPQVSVTGATPAKPAPSAPIDQGEMKAIAALEKVIADLHISHHRQLAAERRRADVAEQRLAAEQARKLTVMERIIGRHIMVPQPPPWPRRDRDTDLAG